MTETPESLAKRLFTYWEVIAKNSELSVKQIAEQSLIAPARCCLKNIGQVGASNEEPLSGYRGISDLTLEERVVELAFNYLGNISKNLREKFYL